MTIPELTLPMALGPFITFIVAAILRRHWGPTARRWVTIGVTAAVTALVLITAPETRGETPVDLAAGLAGAIAACQIAFTLLKPTGIYDRIEHATNSPVEQLDTEGADAQ